jgi:hypothetical protein
MISLIAQGSDKHGNRTTAAKKQKQFHEPESRKKRSKRREI